MVGFGPALGSHPITETSTHLLAQHALTKSRKRSRSWAASCSRRSAAWFRSSASRHTRRPCISAHRYCSTTVRSASASSSCGEGNQVGPGLLSHRYSLLHQPFPPNAPGPWNSAHARSPGRSALFAYTHCPAALGSTATVARAEPRTGARGGGTETGLEGSTRPGIPCRDPHMYAHISSSHPSSPPEASPGVPPAVPPIPDGRSSFASLPELPPLEPRPLKPPHRAARRTRKSWTNQKYGFRTKAKALMAFSCQVARAPPSGASVWRSGQEGRFPHF